MIQKVKATLTAHEGIMNCVLIGVALVLLAVALFGKTEHKVAILVAVVL